MYLPTLLRDRIASPSPEHRRPGVLHSVEKKLRLLRLREPRAKVDHELLLRKKETCDDQVVESVLAHPQECSCHSPRADYSH